VDALSAELMALAMRHALRPLLPALILAGSVACGRPPAPLSRACDSPEALANAVLDGLARRDAAALQALALTEEEFRTRVWPELPAARPGRNVPVDYAWADLSQKSRVYLTQTLARHGGRRYQLVTVEFLGETTRHESFEVARRAQLVVRGADGTEEQIRLFGSMLRAGDEHKVFSYVVD
jgi:hypothetical protein